MIVWLASYPRSGNTFLRVILNSVFNIKTYSIYDDKGDIGADEKTSEVVGHEFLPENFDLQKARDEEKTYYIKTHGKPLDDEDQVIYLIRDGRESTLSNMVHQNSFYNKNYTLKDAIFGNIDMGSWGEHINEWNPKKRDKTLLINFEKLIDTPLKYIKSISEFLNIEPIGGSIPTFKELQEINPMFFRSGKKASWKDTYTDEEHKLFWLKNATQMKEYGYTNDIPAQFNSEILELLSLESKYNTKTKKDIELEIYRLKNRNINLYQENNRQKERINDLYRENNRQKKRINDLYRENNRQKKRINDKDNKLEERRLEIEKVEQENKNLLVINNNFNKLKNTIDTMSQVSIKTHPFKKITAYKHMMEVYNNINIKEQSKDNKPTITIVTVVYNGEQEIEETIKSVIEQTYKDIEYIIVDGASTDNTIKIVKKYEDHIAHWTSEKDNGIYDAMNKGIDLANGKWINFMNAGDTFADNDTLSKIVENTKENNDVIYGDRYYVKNDKKTLQKAKSIDTIFEKMPFGHQSVFIKNEVLKKFKFNDTYKFAADYNLLMQLYLEKYNFQYIEIPICNFISGGQSESGLRPYLEVLKILFDNCKDYKIIENNIYYDAFRNNSETIINKSIKK